MMKSVFRVLVAASAFLNAACSGETEATTTAREDSAPDAGGSGNVEISVVTPGGTYEFTSSRECIVRPEMDAFQFVTTADEAGYEILAFSNQGGLNISFHADDHMWTKSLPPADDTSVIDGKRFTYKGEARVDGDRDNLEEIEITVLCP